MHHEYDNNANWLDEALKDVPLPADLLARLRRLGIDNDARLNSSLRRVPMPTTLLARLKEIPADVAQDAALTKVSVPADLSARLKAIPPAEVDRPLLEPVAAQPAYRSSTVWVVAASLLILAGLGILALQLGTDGLASLYPSPQADDLVGVELVDGLPGDAADTLVVGDVATEDGQPADIPPSPPADPSLPSELIAESSARPSELLSVQPGGFDDPTRMVDDPLLDATLHGSRQLAMPSRTPQIGELELVPISHATHLPPVGDAYDFSALLRDGVHPFVSPRDDPRLANLRVPLSLRTYSYEAYLRAVAAGRDVVPGTIRTEEFLAAVPCRFPLQAPDQAMTLALYGGPAPWSQPRRQWLLVGAQAGDVAQIARPPVDITLVIDPAVVAADWQPLDAVRDAVLSIYDSMQPGDRISLILAGRQPVPLAYDISADRDSLLSAALSRMRPEQLVDIVPSVEAALTRAADRDEGSPRRSIVVCITSDLLHLRTSDRDRLVQHARYAVQRGVELNVVRAAPWQQDDQVARQLAFHGGGQVYEASHQAQVAEVLHRTVWQQPFVVAEQVRIAIRFNPDVVKRYRLLGYDGRDIIPPTEDVGQGLTLLPGQSTVAMIELELTSHVSQDVATAELIWHDPHSRADNILEGTIKRHDFAPSFTEAALPWQRCSLAAAAAESLRQVSTLPEDWNLNSLLALASATHPDIRLDSWYTELVKSISTVRTQHLLQRDRRGARYP